MKAQFRITRRKLIEELKQMRQMRNAIKDKPEMKDRFRKLGEAIVETQTKIDQLNVALGIPVMTNKGFAKHHGVGKVDRK